MGRAVLNMAVILVVCILTSQWVVSPSLAQTGGCVADMFRAVGVPSGAAKTYESSLSKHRISVQDLGTDRPYILKLMGVTNIVHATAFYNCFSEKRQSAACRRYRACSDRGICQLRKSSKNGQSSLPPYACQCTAGFSGTLCHTDTCAAFPCKNGGHCVRTTRKPLFKCTCRKGYRGSTCQTKTQPCKPNPCRNGGSCRPLVGDFQCKCALGYTGKTCQENWLTEKEYRGTIKDLTSDVGEVKVDVKAIRNQLEKSSTARSCKELKALRGTIKSGTYTLQSGSGTWKAYCEMSRSGGGWTRIGEMKPKQTKSCPKTLSYSSKFGGMCARPTSNVGSDPSVSYSSRGISYTEVMGYVNGYQYNTNGAFARYSKDKRFYVDGVTFRYGKNHLWTYGAGGYPARHVYCPCQGGPKPISFVGSHYYCTQDTAATTGSKWVPAWHGSCGGKNCCEASNAFPWFTRSLNEATTSPIRISAMDDQSTADENVAISDMELFIR